MIQPNQGSIQDLYVALALLDAEIVGEADQALAVARGFQRVRPTAGVAGGVRTLASTLMEEGRRVFLRLSAAATDLLCDDGVPRKNTEKIVEALPVLIQALESQVGHPLASVIAAIVLQMGVETFCAQTRP